MQTDYQATYTAAMAQVVAEHPTCCAGLPTLEELKSAITDAIVGEKVFFRTFEAFYQWWDVETTYEAWDTDESPEDHRPLLQVAYLALAADGTISTEEE